MLVLVATVAEEGEEEGEEGDSSTCPLGANATRCHPTSKSSSEAAEAAAAPPPPSPPASEGIPLAWTFVAGGMTKNRRRCPPT